MKLAHIFISSLSHSVARHYWGHWLSLLWPSFVKFNWEKLFILPRRQDSLLLNSHHLDFTRFLLNLIIVQHNSCLLFPALAKPNHVALSLLVKAAKGVEDSSWLRGSLVLFRVHRVPPYWNGVLPWEVDPPNPSSKQRSPEVLKYCTTRGAFHPSLFFP